MQKNAQRMENIYGILEILTSFLYLNGDITIQEFKGFNMEMVTFYSA